MNPAMTELVLDDCAAKEPKAWMIPSTVPNNPMNGALEPSVANAVRPRSSLALSVAR